jgi:hypothetical protein
VATCGQHASRPCVAGGRRWRCHPYLRSTAIRGRRHHATVLVCAHVGRHTEEVTMREGGGVASVERHREGGEVGEREAGKSTLSHVQGKHTIPFSPTNTLSAHQTQLYRSISLHLVGLTHFCLHLAEPKHPTERAQSVCGQPELGRLPRMLNSPHAGLSWLYSPPHARVTSTVWQNNLALI